MNRFGQDVAAIALGVVLAAIVIGVIVLALEGREQPGLLEVIGGATIGALAALATGNRSDNST